MFESFPVTNQSFLFSYIFAIAEFAVRNADKVVNFLSALLTPVIGIVTSYIAYQQYRINKNSEKRELLDRRLRIFKSTVSFIAKILQEGRSDRPSTLNFLRETADSFYLFEPNVREYLYKMYHDAIDLERTDKRLKDLPIGEERNRVVDENDKLLAWFQGQISETERLFKPYLKTYD